MDDISWISMLLMGSLGFLVMRARDQGRRIGLLRAHLGQYQIEKLMEQLTESYLRAMGETDAERRSQIWQLLEQTEQHLVAQFNSFAAGFSTEHADLTRVSRIPLALPYADRWWPSMSFDLRKLLLVHAQGIAQTARNTAQRSARDKAYMLSAELFLMQHSCHWFCKSRSVASARLLARHQTGYAQVLAAVSPGTREAYLAVVGG